MLLWVTRPSAWDVYVKGIGRCEAWCVKPVYEWKPRGDRDPGPLFSHLPIGWVAYDDLGLELTQCCGDLRSLAHDDPVVEELARKVLLDVDPTIDPENFDYQRDWGGERIYELDRDEGQKKRATEFCIPVEFHPDTWVRIMQKAIEEPVVRYTAWLQRVYNSDLPF